MKASELKVGDTVKLPGWGHDGYPVSKIAGTTVYVDYKGHDYGYTGRSDWVVTKPAKPAKKTTPKGAQAYKGNGKHSWERVNTDTERLRVPGGWIYTRFGNPVFVPVPEVVGYAV
jgi:hypothetical protein